MRVYFDNAATTPLDPRVFEAMEPYLRQHFGNPSSTHSHGREVRAALEKSRKTIADLLNVTPSEICFTSGGTEADNTFLTRTIEHYQIKQVISSPLEHHAVLHTLEYLQEIGKIQLHLLDPDENGKIDLLQIEELLKNHTDSLVSLMHANNEIGTINDIQSIAEMAHAYGARMHSDTVQTMGHYRHNLSILKADGIVGAAHKFHGPKGVGFLFIRKGHKINPFIYGGGQERNMRAGTENVYGIIGLAKALEIAYEGMDEHQQHVQNLKTRMIERLKANIEDLAFNGDPEDSENSLYTVLNVSLPESADNDMLLFNLDLQGISASGGSACSSGANVGSHVLNAIGANSRRGAIRFSFSKFNTAEEVDYVVDQILQMMPVKVTNQ